MRLIEKMNKIVKFNDYAQAYSNDVISDYKTLQLRIDKLKEVMTDLSQTRRKDQASEREELIERLFTMLRYIEPAYDCYEADFVDLCHLLKLHTDISLTPKIEQQTLIALNTKKQLINSYETIYNNFKNMAKKLDNIPLKEVLKRMREVFNLNNNDLEASKNNHISKIIKYYDSTTMEIRYIF